MLLKKKKLRIIREPIEIKKNLFIKALSVYHVQRDS